MKQVTRVVRFIQSLVAFLKGAWEELKRTHRPSRQELTAFTIVVLVTIGMITAYVGVLDLLFRWLGSFIYGTQGGT
jgi:preprotein translocase subunit SecE